MAGTPSDYAVNAVACKLWRLVNDDSPVEHVLGVAIFRELASLYDSWRCWVYSEFEFENFRARTDRQDYFAVVPGFTIPNVGHVDFAIFAPTFSTENPLVVVETDGHGFHNTPEQQSEDRRRDRVLQRLGVPILRFTGSDVVRNSAGTAREIAEFVHTKCHEIAAQQAAESDYNDLHTELMYRRSGLGIY